MHASIVSSLLPQDIAALHLTMTGLPFHVCSHMLLMAEENQFRKFVEPIPRHRSVRLLIRKQLLNRRAFFLGCLVAIQAVVCIRNLRELTGGKSRMADAALQR